MLVIAMLEHVYSVVPLCYLTEVYPCYSFGSESITCPCHLPTSRHYPSKATTTLFWSFVG